MKAGDRVVAVLEALGGCFEALTPLEADERRRVLELVDAEPRAELVHAGGGFDWLRNLGVAVVG